MPIALDRSQVANAQRVEFDSRAGNQVGNRAKHQGLFVTGQFAQFHRYAGSLLIPVLEVTIDCSEYDADRIEGFVQQFDRAFLKMGA